jgi:hypothetical protein
MRYRPLRRFWSFFAHRNDAMRKDKQPASRAAKRIRAFQKEQTPNASKSDGVPKQNDRHRRGSYA